MSEVKEIEQIKREMERLNSHQRPASTQPWYHYSLVDAANTSGVSSHFLPSTTAEKATYPAGWTEVDAPPTTNQNDPNSFWLIGGNNSNTAWDYSRQTSINLESQAANAWTTFMVGPLLFKDGRFTADISYHFGIYRNNAGAIDTGTYSRVRIWWDSATTLWKLVAEERDGSSAHSATITLDQNPLNPLFVAFTVQNAAAKATRQLWGASPEIGAMRTNAQNPTSAPTWGQMWVRFHQSRGAGLTDRLRIDALDYLGNVIE